MYKKVNGKWLIKLIDFGMSRLGYDIIQARDEFEQEQRGELPDESENEILDEQDRIFGTPLFLEPQMMLDHMYKPSRSSDTYSLGLSFHGLLYGIADFQFTGAQWNDTEKYKQFVESVFHRITKTHGDKLAEFKENNGYKEKDECENESDLFVYGQGQTLMDIHFDIRSMTNSELDDRIPLWLVMKHLNENLKDFYTGKSVVVLGEEKAAIQHFYEQGFSNGVTVGLLKDIEGGYFYSYGDGSGEGLDFDKFYRDDKSLPYFQEGKTYEGLDVNEISELFNYEPETGERLII